MLKKGFYWARINQFIDVVGWPGYPDGLPNVAYVWYEQGVWHILTTNPKTRINFYKEHSSFCQWFESQYHPCTKVEAIKFAFLNKLDISNLSKGLAEYSRIATIDD